MCLCKKQRKNLIFLFFFFGVHRPSEGQNPIEPNLRKCHMWGRVYRRNEENNPTLKKSLR